MACVLIMNIEKNISAKKSSKILLSSAKMAFATLTSRVLGLGREQVMAHFFGASGLTDAFLVAYRIPNLLRDLFAEGAFSSAFVPTFTEANHHSHEKARKLLWALFISLVLVTGAVTLFIMIFAPEIVALFAPSFVKDPYKFQLTVTMTRMMSPFLLMVSLAALFMGALNSLKIFFWPAMSPACFNVVMILCIVIFPPFLIKAGVPTIYSLGLGVLVGGLFQGLFQLPIIIKRSLGPVWPGKIFDDQVKIVFKKLGPGLIGFSATQINLLVNTILATGTVVGAVSWLSYAFRLFQFPVGVLGVSVGNSNLVHFSDAWKRGKKNEAVDFLQSSYNISLTVILPSMAIMLALSTQIVHIVFEHGKFDHHSTTMTATALNYYLMGLPFYGLYKIFVPTFYALDKQKIPVYTSIVAVALNVIFCLVLTPVYGFKILALGTGLSMFINTVVQAFYLRSELDLGVGFYFNMKILKIISASALAFLTTILVADNLFDFNSSLFIKFSLLLVLISFGFIIFLMALLIFGEAKFVAELLKKIKRN